jgi:O-methyltransferase involved in polyketide biosynthesis
MKQMNEMIASQTIQNTMLIPLWGRATASKRNPKILDDREAIKIVKSLGYRFSALEKIFGEFGSLCYIIRARFFDKAIQAFIRQHPLASVVNIGAGLDTTFSRVDNGKIHWYNLDLPDAIAFRKTLIPDSARNTSISKSMLDERWFDDVKFRPTDGILFIAAGVFYYFKEAQLKALLSAMAKRFPSGELLFDAESKLAVSVSNKMVRKSGNTGAKMFFHLNRAKSLARWSPRIQVVSSTPFFKSVPKSRAWKFSTRLSMFFCDIFGMMKYVRIKFLLAR